MLDRQSPDDPQPNNDESDMFDYQWVNQADLVDGDDGEDGGGCGSCSSARGSTDTGAVLLMMFGIALGLRRLRRLPWLAL